MGIGSGLNACCARDRLVSAGTGARSGSSESPASLPPQGLPGLNPAWSRIVDVVDADGVTRGFHVLDSHAADSAPSPGRCCACTATPPGPTCGARSSHEPPRGWRVVAVDQLGMGWSERITEVRRLGQRVDDLGRLVDALGVDGPVVTVAHDWGGPVSLGWALAHRDQLVGVVLANTAVHQPAGSPAPALIRIARAPGSCVRAVCEQTPTFVRGDDRAVAAAAAERGPRRLRRALRHRRPSPRGRRLRRRHPARGRPPVDARPRRDRRRRPAISTSRCCSPGGRGPGVLRPLPPRPHRAAPARRRPPLRGRLPPGHARTLPAFFADVRAWVERLVPTRPMPPRGRRPHRTRTVDGWVPRSLSAPPTRPLPTRSPSPSSERPAGRITWRQLAPGRRRPRRAGCSTPASGPATVSRCSSRPVRDLTAVGLRLLADRCGHRRGRRRPRCPRARAGAARLPGRSHLIGVDRGLVAARALRIGGRRFAAGPMSPARARLLGAECTLAALASSRAQQRRRALPGPARAGRRGGGRLHLRRDRPGQGRRLPTPSGGGQPRRPPRPLRASPPTTGWSPRSRRSRCTAPRWASPRPCPTWTSPSPATLDAARLADAVRAVRRHARVGLARVAAQRRRDRRRPRPATSATTCRRCGCS